MTLSKRWNPHNGLELSGPVMLSHLIIAPRAGSDPARRYAEGSYIKNNAPDVRCYPFSSTDTVDLNG